MDEMVVNYYCTITLGRPTHSLTSPRPAFALGVADPPHPTWKPSKADFFAEGARVEAGFREFFHRADPDQFEPTYELLVCHGNVIRCEDWDSAFPPSSSRRRCAFPAEHHRTIASSPSLPFPIVRRGSGQPPAHQWLSPLAIYVISPHGLFSHADCTLRALQLTPEAWLRLSHANCGITTLRISGYDGSVSLYGFGDTHILTKDQITFN